jgi:hypothetical protein
VADLFMQAWRQGLKGLTVFRNGGTRKATHALLNACVVLSTDSSPHLVNIGDFQPKESSP